MSALADAPGRHMLGGVDSSHRPHQHPIGSPAAFRPQAKQYALHPLEKTLAGIVITLLIFLPWALGGMTLWAQWIALGLATLAFIVSLIPRKYDDRYHAGGNMRLYMWPKLLRFPILWLGGIYFAVIFCQILNPAWAYRSSSVGWWLEGIDYTKWLPHGIEGTPFGVMNGWRTLMIQGAAWLLICPLWVGVIRRKTCRIILNVLAFNGLILALLIMLQRLVGNGKLLWVFDPQSTYFAGPFVYKNHAGEYLCLIVALCFGLAWCHTTRAERAMSKSHPGLVYPILALAVMAGQMLTYARAATAVTLAFMLVVTLCFVLKAFFQKRGGTPPLVTAITGLLSVGFLVTALLSLDTDEVWRRFQNLGTVDKSLSIGHRQLATQATLDMAGDSPYLGHGAGSFRFLFPRYQQHYPDIYREGTRRLFWEYAHDDYAQFLAEMGLAGVALAALALLAVLIAAWQVNLFSQLGLLLMLGGPLLIAATAAVDFPLHNPAVLLTTLAVIALTLRWAQLSRR
jgi:O-antigen ligase